MKRTLIAILIASTAVVLTPALAQDATPAAASSAPAAKKVAKKKAAKKAATPKVVNEEEAEPVVTGSKVTDYQCELGNKLTVYQNNDDTQHIALKWGKRIHRMARVETSTGADRFENHFYGLLWIGIPAKGMLLDTKTGHQLANECMSAEQRATLAAPATN